MPTETVYKNTIKAVKELIDLGLTGWETEMTITNKKKMIETDVRVIIKLKKRKIKQEKKNARKKTK